MADEIKTINIDQDDAVTAVKLKYKDMGDGTHAEVVAAATVSTSGATTLTKTDRSSALTASSVQYADANTARQKLFIQNLDAAINIHVNLGAAATLGAGSLRLGPGAVLELDNVGQAVFLIAASGTPAATIWEFA